nr:small ubiquitin-related modifier 2-like [Gorilla gorilla gorilla]
MANKNSNEGVKAENNDHINLKVVGQDDSVVQFKIKRHTPLSKLMNAYCDEQLEMEDECTIDVFQQQTGVSTEKAAYFFPPELCSLQTKMTFSVRKLQFGSTTS